MRSCDPYLVLVSVQEIGEICAHFAFDSTCFVQDCSFTGCSIDPMIIFLVVCGPFNQYGVYNVLSLLTVL